MDNMKAEMKKIWIFPDQSLFSVFYLKNRITLILFFFATFCIQNWLLSMTIFFGYKFDICLTTFNQNLEI